MYVPLIEQARKVVGPGKMYVGDSKMAARATRAFIHQQGDVYLCPAPCTVVSEETLACYVATVSEEGRGTTWTWEGEEGEVTEKVGEEALTWQEERCVIREQAATRRALAQLDNEWTTPGAGQADLEALNGRGRGKRRYRPGRRWPRGWRPLWGASTAGGAAGGLADRGGEAPGESIKRSNQWQLAPSPFPSQRAMINITQGIEIEHNGVG
ncbi:MAG: hypothetical protein Q9O62_00115 [Ardenticatenia bacterium]|nr:hypothetical protein [Ardenticatenia bacterium]